jgi:proteasome accessory factor A
VTIIPKLCGADIELGNFIEGRDGSRGTGDAAADALLREIHGLPERAPSYYSRYGGYNAQDRGRRYLRENGGCFYIDLDHLELALPEVRSAYDHVACFHAMLRMAGRAQVAANAKLPEGERIQVLVNNTDGQGHSYGSHLNFLLARKTWNDIFRWKLQQMLFLAAYQVSSIVMTGQGKVGAEDGMPAVEYQLSQRADFFACLVGEQTTFNRPIVNSRDEALCGSYRLQPEPGSAGDRLARLHVIFYDTTLCPVGNLLKVGVMQLVLGLIETSGARPELLLDDPLTALWRWSRDPSLKTTAPLMSGQNVTAVELQRMFWEAVRPLVERGDCDEAVPEARPIFETWGETLTWLERGDFDRLARRLDWVLKSAIIQRALAQHPGLTWASPEIKHLDHLYGSLDGGLYWTMEHAGMVERVVTDEQIARFESEPPDDTRAWTRAMILRQSEPDAVTHVDWDSIEVQLPDRSQWPRHRTLEMADPLSFTRRQTEFLFNGQRKLDDILDCLGATDLNSNGFYSTTKASPSPIIVPSNYESHTEGGRS